MRHFVSFEMLSDLRKIRIYTEEIEETIDAIRRKYNIHIYNWNAPFVTKRNNKNVVLYGFGVKYCSLRRGWNGRELIGKTTWKRNIYDVKRQAIKIAIKWILSHKSQEKCKIKHISSHASK